MIAMVKKAQVLSLAFETMVDAGIIEESAYYESLHELPLIANTIALLYELLCNRVIGGQAIAEGAVDNAQLRDVNEAIRKPCNRSSCKKLRGYMTDMRNVLL
ncbi:unnamed protein product [Ranitomeya imitator]|uniref:Acetohydroxy-acid reductoisomerase n=1 Tax=Ranitomeya imitator TaxID=111125 RepID=A0ABN9MJW7_9NEOB|nr:unnamed protein product [Ranitomeya imitator]